MRINIRRDNDPEKGNLRESFAVGDAKESAESEEKEQPLFMATFRLQGDFNKNSGGG